MTAPRASIRSRVGWSTVSTAIGFAASSASAVAIGHFVDPAEYGHYAVVTSVWGFLVIPIVWCGSVLVRFGPEELVATGRMTRSVGARIVLAAPALLLVPAVPLVARGARATSLVVALSLLWLAVILAQDTLQWASSATQRFGVKAVANLLSRGLPILVVLAPAAAPAYTVRAEHLLAAVVVANAMSSAYLAVALRRWVGVAWPGREELRRVWRYIAPAAWGVPAESLVQWLDPLVLSRFVARAEVGFYQLSYLVISASANVAASFTAVVTNELVWAKARGVEEVQRRYVREQQPRLSLALGYAAFAAACVADPLLRAILGARFAPSGRIAAVLCVAAAFQMASITLAPIRTVTDAQAASQAARLLQAAVNVGGDVLLAPMAGALGVAAANVVAWASNGVSLSVLLRGRAEVSFRPWAALGAAAVGPLALTVVEPSTWLRTAAALAYAAAAGRCGLQLVRGRWPTEGSIAPGAAAARTRSWREESM